MRAWFARRYLDLLGSIYIYNEHRGYTAIDRVLEAIRARSPDDHELIAAVESHRADERKHYVMFRRWFEWPDAHEHEPPPAPQLAPARA